MSGGGEQAGGHRLGDQAMPERLGGEQRLALLRQHGAGIGLVAEAVAAGDRDRHPPRHSPIIALLDALAGTVLLAGRGCHGRSVTGAVAPRSNNPSEILA